MDDVVLEWSIPYVLSKGKRFAKAILVPGMLVLFVDAVLNPLLFLPFLAVLVIGILLIRSWKYEFDYEYVNGDFLISKIIRKEKRVDVFHCTLKEIEYVKAGRERISGMKPQDFTTGWEKAKVYTLRTEQKLIYVEVIDGFLEEMELQGKYTR